MSVCKWTYNNVELEEHAIRGVSSNFYGFVYLIEFEDGTKYIGKKSLNKQLKLTRLKNRTKRIGHIKWSKDRQHEYVSKFDTTVLSYIGSFDKSKFDNNTPVYREILEFAKTKKCLTYLEERYLFINDVLFDSSFRNDNIRGVYFRDEVCSNER